MRLRGYRLASIVSWPAAVWGCLELTLRAATGYGTGWLETAAITACAFAAIIAAGFRERTLAAQQT